MWRLMFFMVLPSSDPAILATTCTLCVAEKWDVGQTSGRVVRVEEEEP